MARLHTRIVGLFSLIAILPTVLLAVVASVTIDRGLSLGFTDRVRDVVLKSVEVADAYQENQCQSLAREIRILADDLTRARPNFDVNRAWFETFLTTRATALGLPVAADHARPDRGGGPGQDRHPQGARLPSAAAFEDAAKSSRPDLPRCRRRAASSPRSCACRPTTTPCCWCSARSASSPSSSPACRGRRPPSTSPTTRCERSIQITFASMFVLIALIVLLSAVWFGLNFANRLRRADPPAHQRRRPGRVGQLLRPGAGPEDRGRPRPSRRDLQQDDAGAAPPARRPDGGERPHRPPPPLHGGRAVGRLGRRHRRRRARASSPSPTRPPSALLEPGARRPRRPAADAGRCRSSRQLLAEARGARRRACCSSRSSSPATGASAPSTCGSRASRRRAATRGFVVTLDDITDLVSAQRTSAWADVARRIAHEIKNPLTPIQLSAERIRRKYGKVITADREIFDQCTDTIVRQVDDIKRMVDEFSSFARMPKPAIARERPRRDRPPDPVHDAGRRIPTSRSRRRAAGRAGARRASTAACSRRRSPTSSRTPPRRSPAVPEAERGKGKVAVRLAVEDGVRGRSTSPTTARAFPPRGASACSSPT